MRTDPERAALLEAISAHLPGWQVKEGATGLRGSIGVLVGPDGAELLLEPEAARLRIWGGFPANYHSYGWREGKPLEITVSVTRRPEVIAREIARRFLPGYLEAYAKALAAQRAAEERARAAKATLARLSRALGSAVGPSSWFSLEPLGVSGFVETHDGRTVTLKLSHVPAALAEQICTILATPGGP